MTIKSLRAAIRELARDRVISEQERDARLYLVDEMVENIAVDKDIWSLYTLPGAPAR